MEEDEIDYKKMEQDADAFLKTYMGEHMKPSPLQSLLEETREMVRAYDSSVIKSRLDNLNAFSDPIEFNTATSNFRENIENTLAGTSGDLEARLIKQAQSLDCLYDFFIRLAQYSLVENEKGLQGHINLALRAQDQSARTIEKFRKLQEKRIRNIGENGGKNPERKEERQNEKKENVE